MRFVVLAAALGALAAAPALGETPPAATFKLVLKDHRFTPATLTVPAGQRFRIALSNQDGTADEFDSDDLHAERDIAPHGRAVIEIAPLKPGTYHFMGELHAATAQGDVVAVTAP